jgi:hypothetical protein
MVMYSSVNTCSFIDTWKKKNDVFCDFYIDSLLKQYFHIFKTH